MPLVNCVRRDLRAVAIGLLIFLALFSGRPALAEESHPGLMAEALYAEAVLAFNRKQSDKALKILNDLLAENPKHVEALQLKALTLKGSGNDAQAIDTYTRLIQLQPEKNRGPYYFELAVIYYRQKRIELARPLFQKAIALDFNAGASHLFLGLADFNAGKLNESEAHFDQVVHESDSEVRMVAYYYRGLINLKNSYGTLAMGDLIEARDIALSVSGTPMAGDIASSTSKLLAPFDKGQWFATFLFLPQYDSNISTAVFQTGSSGLAAVMGNLTAGAGWVSSPLKKAQVVLGLKEQLNAGVVPSDPTQSLNYSYWTQTASFYLNYKPLARHSFGIKIEPSYRTLLQGMAPFSLGGEAGPYYRIQATPHLQFMLEGYARPSLYFTQTDYTGIDSIVRFSTKYESDNRFFNPAGNLFFEYDSTSGNIGTFWSSGVELSNTFRFTPKNTGVLSVDLANFSYYLVSRQDSNFVTHASWVTQLNSHWSILGDAAFIWNNSNLNLTYTYIRWTVGAGVSWTL
ncbi:MAG: tetratricopeptide repeat protein [Bdellovibrionota bacterium]